SMLRPRIGCRTLGRAERIRLPSPAASTTTVRALGTVMDVLPWAVGCLPGNHRIGAATHPNAHRHRADPNPAPRSPEPRRPEPGEATARPPGFEPGKPAP